MEVVTIPYRHFLVTVTLKPLVKLIDVEFSDKAREGKPNVEFSEHFIDFMTYVAVAYPLLEGHTVMGSTR